MTFKLDTNAKFITATVEFQDKKTGKGFDWVGIECDVDDLFTAMETALNKAKHFAAVDGDKKLLARLNNAVTAMVRVNQQWGADGIAL